MNYISFLKIKDGLGYLVKTLKYLFFAKWFARFDSLI